MSASHVQLPTRNDYKIKTWAWLILKEERFFKRKSVVQLLRRMLAEFVGSLTLVFCHGSLGILRFLGDIDLTGNVAS